MRGLKPLLYVAAAAATMAASFLLSRVAPEPMGWYLARSAGLLTYTLLSLSMALGLTMALRGSIPGLGKADVVRLHRGTTVIAFGLLAMHIGALLADRVVGFSLLNVVGFETATFRPAAVFAGSLAAWLMIGTTVAFARRRSLGPSAWRAVHRVSYAAWLLALVHGITAGSDSSGVAAQWLYLLTAVPLTGALIYRIARARAPQPARAKGARPRPSPQSMHTPG